MDRHEKEKPFIDRDRLYSLMEEKAPSENELNAILNKALQFKGLDQREVASLLRVSDPRRYA
jgi:2-iminoacetate synthase